MRTSEEVHHMLTRYLKKNVLDLHDINSIQEDVTSDLDKIILEGEHHILCRNCRHGITRLEHIIAINGNHRHTLINPAGITFQIGCFSSAHGCVSTGNPTFEFTWFEGFQWRYSLCSNCLSHLGWYYSSSDMFFFGLILDQLIETTPIH